MKAHFLSLAMGLALLSNGQTVQLQLVPWATGLSAAVDIAHCGDDRLFVVRQNGLISIVSDSMTVLTTPFLDLSSAVVFSGEQGLLGMAFDPDYTTNGVFYVNYVSDEGGLHSRISRFQVSADPNMADVASEEVIYSVNQPFSNHNGGDLEFGPDGMLYIAFGDGGGTGDPLNNAQDLSDPLGDIIRIDVSDPSVEYAIPPDNPYIGQVGVIPEIWASGLRNPYRFGFDRTTGDLWIGDVGQGAYEEIDHIVAGSAGGMNFGWPCFEGFEPYNDTGCGIAEEYEAPVAVHFNGGDGWCAIIGGRVYRGSVWPNMVGHYIYTDFCVGEFWSISQSAPGEYQVAAALTDNTMMGWSCIGEDVDGELFAGNVENGNIYKITDRCPMERPTVQVDGTLLTSSPAMGYQWYFNGGEIAGATGQSYEATMNGDYLVTGFYAGGCMLKSDIVTIVGTGLTHHTITGPAMAPNPANETVMITLPNGSTLGTLRMIDMQGREVLPLTSLTGTGIVLSTRDLPAGHYVVHFTDAPENNPHVQRLAIVH